jgi:hypothetical protein
MNIIRPLKVMRRHAACDGPIGRLVDQYAYAYECERADSRKPRPAVASESAPVFVSAWGVNRNLEVARG